MAQLWSNPRILRDMLVPGKAVLLWGKQGVVGQTSVRLRNMAAWSSAAAI